ncbi:MAG: response regulator [Armatimonadota bacterium]
MKTILVIEDNPVNLELVTDLLEIAGYEILQAMSAEEGIEQARGAQPDLILMDVRLPGMDGLSATRILKSDAATQHIPVIALTAQAMKGDEEEALAAGCDAYLSKPIDTRALPQVIARVLEEK